MTSGVRRLSLTCVSLCYATTTDGANPESTRPHVRNLLCGTPCVLGWGRGHHSSCSRAHLALGLPADDEPSRRSHFWTVLKIDLRLSYELLDP
ncbi:hypothetical protein GW17_00019677 [Ensete ventricosum]|nr:hypothetical protein GW17_00019677 [Ensete ventricosum]